MQRNPASRFQTWLIVFLVGLAIVLSSIIFWLTRGNNTTPQQDVLSAADEPTSEAAASGQAILIPTVTAVIPSSASFPTPTYVPINDPATNGGGVSAPTQAPVAPAPPQPTPIPATPRPRPTTAVVPVQAQGTTIQLEDDVWGGGYRSARGYGGRSATWIYGAGTDYSSMRALFTLDAQPSGIASLTIEGMDSEDRGKTPIQILINDVEIFNAPNPLPNDDLPLETGTWASTTFTFESALLQPGENTIQINNLKPGQFSRPPFFMLDYAVLAFEPST